MERHVKPLINVAAWREKNRQHAINCRYIKRKLDFASFKDSMFDYQASKHPHLNNACRQLAQKHNLNQLAGKIEMKPQVLRNKLNPDQPRQLTLTEVLQLTDIPEDSALVDGLLAQLHCLPSVPVNELAAEKLTSYVMNAMQPSVRLLLARYPPNA